MKSLQLTQYVVTEEFVQWYRLLKIQKKCRRFPAHIFDVSASEETLYKFNSYVRLIQKRCFLIQKL